MTSWMWSQFKKIYQTWLNSNISRFWRGRYSSHCDRKRDFWWPRVYSLNSHQVVTKNDYCFSRVDFENYWGKGKNKNAHRCWPLSTYHYQLSRRKLTQYWNIILWRFVVIFVNRHPLPSLARQPCFPQEVSRCWIGGESDKSVMYKYASEGIHPGFETQRRFSQKPKIRKPVASQKALMFSIF